METGVQRSTNGETTLEASSPYEIRVNLGLGLPETDVRAALATGDMGFLHSFTTGSAVDGPGIRVVAWTTGCMWRCQYCHNPDTWTITNGLPVTVQRAADELRKYRRGLRVMSGGFTLSGGEPLMQHRFAVKLLTAAKNMGIHTTIETNGYYGDKLSDADLGAIDLVMLGVKTWGEDRHLALTGLAARAHPGIRAAAGGIEEADLDSLRARTGLTDDPEQIGHIAKYAAGLGNVERIEVLPFHQLGRYKWERLNLPYTLANTEPPTAAVVDRTLDVFRAEGLQAY